VTRVRLPLWLAIPGVVLVVLVLVNALTFLVAEQRRATQLHAERFEALAGRLSAFADLYRRLPEMDRVQLERIAQVRGERLVVQGRPRVGADRVRDPRLESRLRAGMELERETDIRVALRGRPSFNLFEPRRAQQLERLVVAVRLGPDAWLNADFHWPIGEPVLPGLVLSAGVSGVVLVGLGLWLGRRLSVPLEALAHAAERLHAGQQVMPGSASCRWSTKLTTSVRVPGRKWRTTCSVPPSWSTWNRPTTSSTGVRAPRTASTTLAPIVQSHKDCERYTASRRGRSSAEAGSEPFAMNASKDSR